MKQLSTEVNNKWEDCTINDICEEIWYYVYVDLSYSEYPESDKDWFKLFKDYYDPCLFEMSEKEMLDNRDTIIQYGKKYIEKRDSDNYNEAVNIMFDRIDDIEFDYIKMYNPKLIKEAKKEAITKLYNKYCK